MLDLNSSSIRGVSQGCQSLKPLLTVNKRLNTASLLKESLGHLCDSPSKALARRQRRAYGLRDEDYLRLKILSWMLTKRACSSHREILPLSAELSNPQPRSQQALAAVSG